MSAKGGRMIYLLTGENEFLRQERIRELTAGKQYERYDGEDLTQETLQTLMLGQTLFGDSTVIINGLSDNPNLWNHLPDDYQGHERTIILLETKPDRRTKTYRWLQKNAVVEGFDQFNSRQAAKLISWYIERARRQYSYELPQSLAEMIVARIGVDMMRLDNVLSQLALSGPATQERIDALLPLPKAESAFELYESVLRKDPSSIRRIIRFLEAGGSDGAYQTFGLIIQQANSFTALVRAGGDIERVAHDFKLQPFTLRKLSAYVGSVDQQWLKRMATVLFLADKQLKTTPINPWTVVEVALIQLCETQHNYVTSSL